MAEIIDLKDRKKLKTDLSRPENLEGLQSLFRCSLCARRCAKCGRQDQEVSLTTHFGSRVSFRLCPLCLEEYQHLLACLETERRPDAPFWYNREWLRQWLTWIDYQEAMVEYMASPEVLLIIEELKKG